MRYLAICVSTFFFIQNIYAQDKTNEVAKYVCDCITEHKENMDSALIQYCYTKAFHNIAGLPTSEKSLDKLFEKVHYTLGKTCAIYVDAMNKVTPQKGDWKSADSTTMSKLGAEECRQMTTRNLYY